MTELVEGLKGEEREEGKVEEQKGSKDGGGREENDSAEIKPVREKLQKAVIDSQSEEMEDRRGKEDEGEVKHEENGCDTRCVNRKRNITGTTTTTLEAGKEVMDQRPLKRSRAPTTEHTDEGDEEEGGEEEEVIEREKEMTDEKAAEKGKKDDEGRDEKDLEKETKEGESKDDTGKEKENKEAEGSLKAAQKKFTGKTAFAASSMSSLATAESPFARLGRSGEEGKGGGFLFKIGGGGKGKSGDGDGDGDSNGNGNENSSAKITAPGGSNSSGIGSSSTFPGPNSASNKFGNTELGGEEGKERLFGQARAVRDGEGANGKWTKKEGSIGHRADGLPKAVIPLSSPSAATTGEEGESTVFSCRAKLYTFVRSEKACGEWRERGVGMVKLNITKVCSDQNNDLSLPQSNTSPPPCPKPRARLIMRADGSHRLLLNSPIHKNLSAGSVSGEMPTGELFLFQGISESGKAMEILQFKMKPQNAQSLWTHMQDIKRQIA